MNKTFKKTSGKILGLVRSLSRKGIGYQQKVYKSSQCKDELDVKFYKDFYSDIHHLSDAELREHYSTIGKPQRRFANDAQAVMQLRGNPALPADFNVADYLTLNDDVKQAIRWQSAAITHFLKHGRAEGRAFKIEGSAQSGLYDPTILTKYPATENLATLRAFLASHRTEMLRLPVNFNLVTYLAQNHDIRAAAQHSYDGLKHYFNHGIHENRILVPAYFNCHFVKQIYGVDFSSSMPVEVVLQEIRAKHDFSPGHLIFLSEEELFLFHGITNFSHLLDLDRSYYCCGSPELIGMDISKSECMMHFCKFGQYKGLDVSYLNRFDPNFYRMEYLHDWTPVGNSRSEASAADRLRLFQDWLRSPRESARAPNLEVSFMKRFGFPIPASMMPKLIAFRNLVPPIASGTLLEAAQHLVESGGTDVKLVPISSFPEAEFFDAVAEKLDSAGQAHKADVVYHHILQCFPEYWITHTRVADRAFRRGDFLVAAHVRKGLIQDGRATYWNYRLLGDCFMQLDAPEEALDTLRQGIEAYPSDVQLRSKFRETQGVVFEKLWRNAGHRALMLGYGPVQEDLRAFLKQVTASFEWPRTRRTIRRIAILGSYDLHQCRYYRIDQKVEQLREAGYEVFCYDSGTETSAFVQNLLNVDLALFFRVAAFPHIINAIAQARRLGVVTIYDIDDLIFSTEHFPPSLESYAGQISTMLHAEIACGVPLFEHAMSLCEYGMASTRALSRHVQARVESGIAFVHPNALSKTQFARRRSAFDRDEIVTVFYGSGTKAHKQDFRDVIEPAIARLAAKYLTKIRFILMGYIVLGEELTPYQDIIRVIEPIANFEDYCEHLSEADINLSVLSWSEFNDCKSEIKWLEAAAMGIPSVVSRSTTYEQVIEDGRTGFLCDTSEDFFVAIDRLVRDGILRKTVGNAAQAATYEAYSCHRQAENLRAVVARIEERMSPIRKRLLVVNVFYPPQAIGGATRVVHDNVRDLRQRLGDDWQIDVICTLDGGAKPYEITPYVQDGIRVFAITAADLPGVDHLLEDPRIGEAFETCFGIIQPDIVHFHCIQRLTTSIIDVPIKHRVPYIITMHDGWWISPNQFLIDDEDAIQLYNYGRVVPLDARETLLPERARRLRRYLSSAALITTVSDKFAETCRAAGLDGIRVVENGVSCLPKPTRAPRGDKCRVVIAHIGGTSRHKGYHHVTNLFRTQRFENLSLLVIDHALSPDLSREETWGNTPVILQGKIPQRQVEELYGRIDVLLAPSVWPESYGLVTREAIAAGCWVIASDRGAVGDCVTPGENGLLIDVSSPIGLLAALRTIDADPERYRNPPAFRPEIRMASDQAAELSALYEDLLVQRQSWNDTA